MSISYEQQAKNAPISPFESDKPTAPLSRLDNLVAQRLRARGLQAACACSDEVFARRVYLDVIGTAPTADEARAFLKDNSSAKRKTLIDTLLNREEFAEYWAMKWCEVLRVKAEFPINLWPNAVQAYHHWIRECIRENMPYNRFARELLTATGSNFHAPSANFYRAVQSKQPEGLAKAVALSLMGARAEKWPKGRLAAMAVFFTQLSYKQTLEWKEEIVIYDPSKTAGMPKDGRTVFPDGTPVKLTPGRNPREVFADWLVSPKNWWFGRNVVNRLWCWLMGRGIINESDDIRATNPPANPELLALLERELVAGHYDLKHVFRIILNSRTYQQSAIPRSKDPAAEALFASYSPRRVEAEVLIDMLNTITGTTETYSSATPEPYTYIPEDVRSISLADGSITSSFLELFGRPARDTGMVAERNNNTTADQRLHMLNSSHIRYKLERGPKMQPLLKVVSNPRKNIEDIYLTFLSRYPTTDELKTLTDYAAHTKLAKRDQVIDLAWALVNSVEFQFRH